MMLILISGVTALIMSSGGKMDSDTGAQGPGGRVWPKTLDKFQIILGHVYIFSRRKQRVHYCKKAFQEDIFKYFSKYAPRKVHV